MGVHAKLSASKTKEWMAAPGIIALHERFPIPNHSGEAAQMGTCVHALIEHCLETGEDATDYIDRILQIVNEGTPEERVKILGPVAKAPKAKDAVWFVMDADLTEAGQAMITYVRDRMDEMGHPELDLEERTNPLPDRDDTGGTADVTLHDPIFCELEIIDYKNGTGVFVPVEANKQLLSYLLGRVLDLLGVIRDDYTYRMTIVQPRHYLSPDDGVMPVEVSADELREFQNKLIQTVGWVDHGRELMDELFAKYGPKTSLEHAIKVLDDARLLEVTDLVSDKIWDPYLAKCPSARRIAEEATQMDFMDDPEDPNEIDLTEKSADWLLNLHNHKAFITALFKEAETEVEKRLMAREPVKGFKLVQKMGNRTWVEDLDEADLQEWVEENGGDKNKLYTPPGKPELKTGVQSMNTMPKAKKKEFEEKFLYKPKGAIIAVPDTDKRSEYVPETAADDFAEDE